MTETLHPQVASLAQSYARDLARCIPSRGLDARIDRLVAAPRKNFQRVRRPPPATHVWVRWAAAACLGTLAVACETHRTRRDRPIPVLPDLHVDDDHVVIPHDLERYDAK